MNRLSLTIWTIPADQDPAWPAGSQAMEDLSVEDLTDGLADLLVDVPEVQGNINPYEVEDPSNLQAMPLVKEQLLKDLAMVREAIEGQYENLMDRHEVGGQKLYITGGTGYGGAPVNPLHGAMLRLQAAPIEKTVAEAIGFEIL